MSLSKIICVGGHCGRGGQTTACYMDFPHQSASLSSSLQLFHLWLFSCQCPCEEPGLLTPKQETGSSSRLLTSAFTNARCRRHSGSEAGFILESPPLPLQLTPLLLLLPCLPANHIIQSVLLCWRKIIYYWKLEVNSGNLQEMKS